MNILLWLTDRPAYRMIKKIRWEIQQVMDLADKLRNTIQKNIIVNIHMNLYFKIKSVL